MQKRELILWGLRKGENRPWMEELLLTHATSMEEIKKIKKIAEKEGWHHFRVDFVDLTTPPDFTKTIRR